jgi:hypothetical protein
MEANEESTAARRQRRSPGLMAFRLNPFRVLRLPTKARPEEAVWQAEKVLTRVRAGVEPSGVDLVAWLEPNDELEVQEATQKIEEPLARLVAECLWFDLEIDPAGTQLGAALPDGPGPALDAYLALAESELGLPKENDETDDVEAMKAATSSRMRALTAHRVNQANVRLLLAFAGMHRSEATRMSDLPAKLQIDRKGGLPRVADPHLILIAEESDQADAWANLLTEGLERWAKLFKEPWYQALIEHQIERLGDELLTKDDAESIYAAVKTQIADLVVGEMKARMIAGRLDQLAALLDAVSGSGLDAGVWSAAMRPLRALFRHEVDELKTILKTDAGPPKVEDLQIYVQRLQDLAERWKDLDESGLLGLKAIIDESLIVGLNALRHRPTDAHEPIEALLTDVAKTTPSKSVHERVNGFRTMMQNDLEALCHFCKTRQRDEKFCGAIKGRRETHREPMFNGVRIHYSITAGPIARCGICAEVHELVNQAGWVGGVVGTVLAGALALMFGSEQLLCPMAFGVGLLAILGWFGGRELASHFAREEGEASPSDWQSSKTHMRIRGDGFYEIKVDLAKHAWRDLNASGRITF